MTTLVEEMREAIKEGRPAYRGDDFDYDVAAQAALDCVLKRLAMAETVGVMMRAMADLGPMPDAADHKEAWYVLNELITHLDQERSRE
jgi:hypothetical protein